MYVAEDHDFGIARMKAKMLGTVSAVGRTLKMIGDDRKFYPDLT